MSVLVRCPWPKNDAVYIRYHDVEWGVAVTDDHKQFEFLVLESAQAGLSWETVLKKRENYRKAYLDFDAERIANFGETDIARLLANEGIIRNRMKIEASVNNARQFLKVASEFGSFSRYLWAFVDFKPVVNHWDHLSQMPAKTALSEKICIDMKKRGFKFLGPVIIYAHLQATGLVNDHLVSCFRHSEIDRMPFPNF